MSRRERRAAAVVQRRRGDLRHVELRRSDAAVAIRGSGKLEITPAIDHDTQVGGVTFVTSLIGWIFEDTAGGKERREAIYEEFLTDIQQRRIEQNERRVRAIARRRLGEAATDEEAVERVAREISEGLLRIAESGG